MAIYVYYTSNGVLYSWTPNDTDPVAPPSVLAAQGMASKSGLPPLDSTHVWDAPTQTVVVVTAPTPAAYLATARFIGRFTHPEWRLISGNAPTDDYANHFLAATQSSQTTNLNDPTVQDFIVNYGVSKTWWTTQRARQILDTTGLVSGGAN
jgi:hypothetical protein